MTKKDVLHQHYNAGLIKSELIFALAAFTIASFCLDLHNEGLPPLFVWHPMIYVGSGTSILAVQKYISLDYNFCEI